MIYTSTDDKYLAYIDSGFLDISTDTEIESQVADSR